MKRFNKMIEKRMAKANGGACSNACYAVDYFYGLECDCNSGK